MTTAGPVDERFDGQGAEITELRQEVADLKAGQNEEIAVTQQALLEEEHEDWEDVFAAKGTLEWLSDQPRHIQEAAYRNAEEIVDAEEAADIVSRLKAFRSAQPGNSTGNNADESDSDTDDDTGKDTGLSARRKRQLDASSSSRTGGAGAAHGIPEDGDEAAIWDAMDKQEARKAKSA